VSSPKRRGRPPKKKPVVKPPDSADCAVIPPTVDSFPALAHIPVVSTTGIRIIDDNQVPVTERPGVTSTSFTSQKRPRSPGDMHRIMESNTLVTMASENEAETEAALSLDVRPTKLARADGDPTHASSVGSNPQLHSVSRCVKLDVL
jgi:hypothetical protein